MAFFSLVVLVAFVSVPFFGPVAKAGRTFDRGIFKLTNKNRDFKGEIIVTGIIKTPGPREGRGTIFRVQLVTSNDEIALEAKYESSPNAKASLNAWTMGKWLNEEYRMTSQWRGSGMKIEILIKMLKDGFRVRWTAISEANKYTDYNKQGEEIKYPYQGSMGLESINYVGVAGDIADVSVTEWWPKMTNPAKLKAAS